MLGNLNPLKVSTKESRFEKRETKGQLSDFLCIKTIVIQTDDSTGEEQHSKTLFCPRPSHSPDSAHRQDFSTCQYSTWPLTSRCIDTLPGDPTPAPQCPVWSMILGASLLGFQHDTHAWILLMFSPLILVFSFASSEDFSSRGDTLPLSLPSP